MPSGRERANRAAVDALLASDPVLVGIAYVVVQTTPPVPVKCVLILTLSAIGGVLCVETVRVVAAGARSLVELWPRARHYRFRQVGRA